MGDFFSLANLRSSSHWCDTASARALTCQKRFSGTFYWRDEQEVNEAIKQGEEGTRETKTIESELSLEVYIGKRKRDN